MTHPLPAFVGLYAGLPIMQPTVISDVHNYAYGANPYCVNPATCNYFYGNHVCTTVQNPTSTVIWIDLKLERGAEDKIRIQGAKYQGRLDSLVSKHVVPSVATYFAKSKSSTIPVTSAAATVPMSQKMDLGKDVTASELRSGEDLIQCALRMACITSLELEAFTGAASIEDPEVPEIQAANNGSDWSDSISEDYFMRATGDTGAVGTNSSVSGTSFGSSSEPGRNDIDALPDNERPHSDDMSEELTIAEISEASITVNITVSSQQEVLSATDSLSGVNLSDIPNGALNDLHISPDKAVHSLVHRRLKKHEWMTRWLYSNDNVLRVVQRTGSVVLSPYMRQRQRRKGLAKAFHIIQSPVLVTGAKGSVKMDFMESELQQSHEDIRELDNLKMLSDVAYARALSSTSGSSDFGEQDDSDATIGGTEKVPVKIRPKLKPAVQETMVSISEEEDLD